MHSAGECVQSLDMPTSQMLTNNNHIRNLWLIQFSTRYEMVSIKVMKKLRFKPKVWVRRRFRIRVRVRTRVRLGFKFYSNFTLTHRHLVNIKMASPVLQKALQYSAFCILSRPMLYE